MTELSTTQLTTLIGGGLSLAKAGLPENNVPDRQINPKVTHMCVNRIIALIDENRPPIPPFQLQSASQIHAQNTLKAPLKRLNSALIRTLQLLLRMRFVVFLGPAGLRFRLQFRSRCFHSLLAGYLHSFSIHIDSSFLHVRRFSLWS